jgi:P27 family predicted phage terminase small subunit
MSKRRLTALELVNRTQERGTIAPARDRKHQKKAPHAPPDRLSRAQKDIWVEVEGTVRLLHSDLFLLETLVCLLDQQRVLQLLVNQDGPIVRQINGRSMHNPAATALRSLEPQLTRCFKELGMSPATRKRLKLDCSVNDELGEWAEF